MSININCGEDLSRVKDRLRMITRKLRKDRKISRISHSEAMRYMIDEYYCHYFFDEAEKEIIDKAVNGGVKEQ